MPLGKFEWRRTDRLDFIVITRVNLSLTFVNQFAASLYFKVIRRRFGRADRRTKEFPMSKIAAILNRKPAPIRVPDIPEKAHLDVDEELFSSVGAELGSNNEVLRNLLLNANAKIGELDSIKDSVAKLVGPVSKALREFETEKADKINLQAALSNTRTAYGKLRNEVTDLEKRATKAEREAEQLRKDLTFAENAAKALETVRGELAVDIAQRRAQIATQAAQMRAAEAAAATASQERSRMQLELSAREREALQAQLETERREAAAARERAAREAQVAAEQAARAERQARERTANLSGEISRLQLEMPGLEAREAERGWVLRLREEVLFDSGRATMKPGSERALERLAGLMQNQPSRRITIEGFTDNAGAPEANQRLSEARAAAVKQALVARGVDPSRIDSRGHGPAFPVASNQTELGRRLNRRVEIVIAPPQPSASAGGATR